MRGEPPPLSSRRPNAKDDLRAKARQLRQHGLDYKAIAAELGVSKSSVSLWVRDLPRPERLSHEECQKRHKQAMAKYWSEERVRIAAGGVPKRTAFADQAREARYELAATQIGPLTDRDIFIGGVVACWNYYGCLRIDVRRSSGLFTTIEGWSAGILRDQVPSTNC